MSALMNAICAIWLPFRSQMPASSFSEFSMFALLVAVDGGVEASIVAQGAAGTFSSHLACFRLHAASVISSGQARNVLFSEIRT